MTRLLLTLAAIGSLAAVDGRAQNAVTPPPFEQARQNNILMDVPGRPGGEVFDQGIQFDLFSGPVQAQPRCENIFETVDGARTLVGVRCSDR